MEGLEETPGKANNVLDALRASAGGQWASRVVVPRSALGVAHFADGEGHKPWTPEQLKIADEQFTGMLRRAYVLARYTGQRISDVVRLGCSKLMTAASRCARKKPASPMVPIFPEFEIRDGDSGKAAADLLFLSGGKPFGDERTVEGVQQGQDRLTPPLGMRCGTACARTPSFTIASPVTRLRKSAT